MQNRRFENADHAQIYSVYRKEHPEKLAKLMLEYLRDKVDGDLNLAVDVGCGSGQSTVLLAPYFRDVIGTDISKAMIGNAIKTRLLKNVQYVECEAECIPASDSTVQIVTTGTSLHWFDQDKFFREVHRVLVPSGIFASYDYLQLLPYSDDENKAKEIKLFFDELDVTLDYYWRKGGNFITNWFDDIKFPFREVVKLPDIKDTFPGKLSDIWGYLTSLSSFQRMKSKSKARAEDFLSRAQTRLMDILDMTDASQTLTLWRTYRLIMCREFEE